MNKVKKKKRKTSENSVSKLWDPRQNIERF